MPKEINKSLHKNLFKKSIEQSKQKMSIALGCSFLAMQIRTKWSTRLKTSTRTKTRMETSRRWKRRKWQLQNRMRAMSCSSLGTREVREVLRAKQTRLGLNLCFLKLSALVWNQKAWHRKGNKKVLIKASSFSHHRQMTTLCQKRRNQVKKAKARTMSLGSQIKDNKAPEICQ